MLKLVQTCGACPEQYDAYQGDNQVGYLRLRGGYFYAECHGVRVYEADTIGDGIFKEYERTKHLNAACRAIEQALLQQDEVPIYEMGYKEEN